MFGTHLGESHLVCIRRGSIWFRGGADPDHVSLLGSIHPRDDLGRLAWETATGKNRCVAITTLRYIGHKDAHFKGCDRISRDSLSDHARTCGVVCQGWYRCEAWVYRQPGY
jgi:hypothetical protein